MGLAVFLFNSFGLTTGFFFDVTTWTYTAPQFPTWSFNWPSSVTSSYPSSTSAPAFDSTMSATTTTAVDSTMSASTTTAVTPSALRVSTDSLTFQDSTVSASPPTTTSTDSPPTNTSTDGLTSATSTDGPPSITDTTTNGQPATTNTTTNGQPATTNTTTNGQPATTNTTTNAPSTITTTNSPLNIYNSPTNGPPLTITNTTTNDPQNISNTIKNGPSPTVTNTTSNGKPTNTDETTNDPPTFTNATPNGPQISTNTPLNPPPATTSPTSPQSNTYTTTNSSLTTNTFPNVIDTTTKTPLTITSSTGPPTITSSIGPPTITSSIGPPTTEPNDSIFPYAYHLVVPHTTEDTLIHTKSTLNIFVSMTTTESSNISASVSVFHPFSDRFKVTVQPGSEVTIQLKPLLAFVGSGQSNRTVVVQASGLIQLMMFTRIDYLDGQGNSQVQSLAATYVSPYEMLHTEYLLVTPCQTSNTSQAPSSCRVFVVSTSNFNSVTIRFSQYATRPLIAFTINGIRIVKPEVLAITLGGNDVLFLESEGDLTGSKVTALKPVAIFIGLKENDGTVSYEQFLPVFDETKSLMTWSPSTSTGLYQEYRVSTGAANNTLYVSDTCKFGAGLPTHVTADEPVTGLQLLRSSGGIACITSLVSHDFWRWSYAFSVPANVTSRGGPNETVFIDLIVVIRTGYQADLLLDGNSFGPDDTQNVFPGKDYVVIIKRIDFGFHSVRSSSRSYFGAYILGVHPRTTFCTTAGLDSSNHSHAVLGEFPIPGNKLIDINLTENPTSTLKATSPAISTAASSANSTTTTLTFPAGAGQSSTTSPAADSSPTSTQPTSRPSTCNPAGAAAPQLTNLSKAQLAEIVENIRQALLLDYTRTSSFMRRLSSAGDTRPSCVYIGVMGTVLVASVFLLLASGDVTHVLVWLWENIRHRH